MVVSTLRASWQRYQASSVAAIPAEQVLLAGPQLLMLVLTCTAVI
jgi:hypothetical protein